MRVAIYLALTTTAVLAQKVSRDGCCGGSLGQTCLKSSFGECCNKDGFCGASPAYCRSGCQPKFGHCDKKHDNNNNNNKGHSRLKSSHNGRCGSGTGLTCFGFNHRDTCCSRHGRCGYSDAYCGRGCQVGFGECHDAKPLPGKPFLTTSTYSRGFIPNIFSGLPIASTPVSMSPILAPDAIQPSSSTASFLFASSAPLSSVVTASSSPVSAAFNVAPISGALSSSIASSSSIALSSLEDVSSIGSSSHVKPASVEPLLPMPTTSLGLVFSSDISSKFITADSSPLSSSDVMSLVESSLPIQSSSSVQGISSMGSSPSLEPSIASSSSAQVAFSIEPSSSIASSSIEDNRFVILPIPSSSEVVSSSEVFSSAQVAFSIEPSSSIASSSIEDNRFVILPIPSSSEVVSSSEVFSSAPMPSPTIGNPGFDDFPARSNASPWILYGPVSVEAYDLFPKRSLPNAGYFSGENGIKSYEQYIDNLDTTKTYRIVFYHAPFGTPTADGCTLYTRIGGQVISAVALQPSDVDGVYVQIVSDPFKPSASSRLLDISKDCRYSIRDVSLIDDVSIEEVS
ncbi:hypothetical protein IQ06DRAFT_110359 [Phaeosphaeriaceae sp. SRC1lsM3a]|nr:hypothetical protein IQ06DRAFT_110359 [Stagonospora sp. SRC1lsM3a]